MTSLTVECNAKCRLQKRCWFFELTMCRTVLTSGLGLLLMVLFVGVTTAPVYPHLRGTHYTISNTADVPRKPYLEVRNATYHGIGPREEARAMCSVKTQEVNATANATITRRLHGVVTSRELHSSIQRLEVIIFGQMQQLWQSLDALRAQLSGDARAHYPDRRTIAFQYKPDSG